MKTSATLLAAFIFSMYALASELEFRTYEDHFEHCMKVESPATDSEIMDAIAMCEVRTGYKLDEKFYP